MNSRALADYACIGGIVLATAWAYFRVPSFQYLNWDDNVYVVQRYEIHSGLTLSGVTWAFSTFEAANWHPLVWLSFMCEIELFGVASGAMHATNLVLHLANTLLVAILIGRLTGRMRFGLVVAALFGLHPQHVEAVAWISERKELLCVFFGLLAMLAWHECRVRYRRHLWIAAHVLFALSLLSKQMLVTLPFLLLVIEFSPLSELKRTEFSLQHLLLAARNKAGFFLLAFAALAAAFAAQNAGGAIADSQALSLWVRLTNAVSSIGLYLAQTLIPIKLSPFYRHPVGNVSISLVVASLVGLTAISLFVWRLRFRPGIVAGWLWFLGTLMPVIGIVQLGAAARADRYTYFPHIGLFLMLNAAPLPKTRTLQKTIPVVFCSFLLIGGCLTFQQTAMWHDSISLWQAVLQEDADSYRAHEHLATAFLEAGRIDDAVVEGGIALQYPENIRSSQSYKTLGTALLKSGQLTESVRVLRLAADLAPDDAVTLLHLAYGLRESDPMESFALFEQAGSLAPNNIECISGLANAEARRGNFRRAVTLYRAAEKISPNDQRLKENLRIIEDAASQVVQ